MICTARSGAIEACPARCVPGYADWEDLGVLPFIDLEFWRLITFRENIRHLQPTSPTPIHDGIELQRLLAPIHYLLALVDRKGHTCQVFSTQKPKRPGSRPWSEAPSGCIADKKALLAVSDGSITAAGTIIQTMRGVFACSHNLQANSRLLRPL